MYANRKLISLIWPRCGTTCDSIHVVPASAACEHRLFLVACIQLRCLSLSMKRSYISDQIGSLAEVNVDLNWLCISLAFAFVYLFNYWMRVPFPQMQISSTYIGSYIGPLYTTPCIGSIYVGEEILTPDLCYLVCVPLYWWSITRLKQLVVTVSLENSGVQMLLRGEFNCAEIFRRWLSQSPFVFVMSIFTM